VWHLQQDARATADSERREAEAKPSDVPHPRADYDERRWHADEAEGLAKLAELTAWSNDSRYAAELWFGDNR
jgi:hypothetical protein